LHKNSQSRLKATVVTHQRTRPLIVYFFRSD
jgi:hypothetical protein